MGTFVSRSKEVANAALSVFGLRPTYRISLTSVRYFELFASLGCLLRVNLGIGQDLPASRVSGEYKMQNQAANQADSLFFLLFDRTPRFEPGAVLTAIESIEPAQQGKSWNGRATDTLIRFEDHAFLLVTVSASLPAEFATVVSKTNWALASKQRMQQHVGHIACKYSGANPDPTEQLVAVLKLAAAMVPFGLVGISHWQSGISVPAEALTVVTQIDVLAESRRTIPIGIWTGFETYAQPDGRVWFRTRGFHRWGKPDLAYLGEQREASEIQGLFQNLLSYMRDNGLVLKAGQTANNGDSLLTFSLPAEDRSALESSNDIVVVQRAKLAS